MANTSSAQKAVRKIRSRTAVNKSRRSRILTFVRKVELALTSKNTEAATSAFLLAQPELMRGATKGILHKNTAARKISRLAKRVKLLSSS